MSIRKEHHRYSRQVTRTKRWKVLRIEILERDGFRCRECSAKGRLEVDHIKPVRTHPELSYDPANLQALCPSCHTRKTRLECGHKPRNPKAREWDAAVSDLEANKKPKGQWSVPFDLLPSRVPVMVVCGPPGAGKNTYITANAAPTDMVIDFDDYLASVGGAKWDKDPERVQAAFRMRNGALRSLNTKRRGTAWLPITAPSLAERNEWKRRLGRAKIIMLAVDADTCKARIRADPDRQHAIEPMCAGVDRWWRIYAADGGISQEQKGK